MDSFLLMSESIDYSLCLSIREQNVVKWNGNGRAESKNIFNLGKNCCGDGSSKLHFSVEKPKDTAHGDFSSNIAMALFRGPVGSLPPASARSRLTGMPLSGALPLPPPSSLS